MHGEGTEISVILCLIHNDAYALFDISDFDWIAFGCLPG